MKSFVWWQNILNSKHFHDGLQLILNKRHRIKLQGRVLTNACKLEHWLICHMVLLANVAFVASINASLEVELVWG